VRNAENKAPILATGAEVLLRLAKRNHPDVGRLYGLGFRDSRFRI
jgi:hypothetical protein